MLDIVDVGESPLEAYRGVAPDELLDAVTRAARALRGARVLHLNATPYGGGVSELLRSVVPLLNDQGVHADWRIISGNEPFFQVTKTIHNGLQGADVQLSEADKERYLATSRDNAAEFDGDYDFIFIHDPQPAALVTFTGKGRARWIWRSHIDTSNPNPDVWSFLRPFLAEYDGSIFTMPEFVPRDLPTPIVDIIPPAIDPRNPKNLALPAGDGTPGARMDRRAHRAAARHPGVALRRLEGSARRHRSLPAGAPGDSRPPAGPGRVDGHRRSRRLGHVPHHSPRVGQGKARARVHESHRRRQHRGQRLPGPVEGGDPEVRARRLRPGRRRGLVEGNARRRRPHRRHPAADGRRHGRHSRRQRRGRARGRWSPSSATTPWLGRWARAAASACVVTS